MTVRSDKREKKARQKYLISLFREYRQNKAKSEASAEELAGENAGVNYGGTGVKTSGGNGIENKIIKWLDKKDYYRRCCLVVEHTQFYVKHCPDKKEVMDRMLLRDYPPVNVSMTACVSVPTLYRLRADILNYALYEAEDYGLL